MRKIILFFLFSFVISILSGQGYLLVIPNADCEITVDGEMTESLTKNTPRKLTLIEGEHLIQAKGTEGELMEIVQVEKDKQKVLKLVFGKEKVDNAQKETIPQAEANSSEEPFRLVADLNLTLLGGINAIADESFDFDIHSDLYYAFEEGDIVLLDGKITNKKGRFFIQIVAYPDMSPVYSKQKLEDLKNHQFPIHKRGIYIFRIGTSALFDKKVNLTIKRKPKNADKRNFRTRVEKRYRYESVKILEPGTYHVNSTSNETWRNGTNEIDIPISTPPNTVEWYYVISASRNKQEIDNNLKSTSLFKDLAKTLTNTDPTLAAINIGLNLFTKPPGSDYCDVYFLDYQNRSLFLNDQPFSHILVGSRKNVKSDIVKIKGGLEGQYYLGIENTDTFHGIHIGLEAVAVVQEVYLDYVE